MDALQSAAAAAKRDKESHLREAAKAQLEMDASLAGLREARRELEALSHAQLS